MQRSHNPKPGAWPGNRQRSQDAPHMDTNACGPQEVEQNVGYLWGGPWKPGKSSGPGVRIPIAAPVNLPPTILPALFQGAKVQELRGFACIPWECQECHEP